MVGRRVQGGIDMYVKSDSPDGFVTFTTIRIAPEETLVMAHALWMMAKSTHPDAPKAAQMATQIVKSFTEREDE